ncbi:proline and serine-rich protein 2 isoform X2 [Mastacembelus armatus]|nr:proline and serine-rich protein 2 isoform X2 [Mastacembelus armatus]XP_026182119.1 proline and serine-rich protein 2 isoform X2 [Mastacembelus armatus]
MARPPSSKDHDIIDLVHSGPDLVQPKEPVFNPTNPDFQSMLQTPESHFEMKSRRDPMDSLDSDYNPPLPSGSYGPTDGHSYYPPGCIPTPVLIAQKIAENQSGGTSSVIPSSLQRHQSLESEKPPGYSNDLSVKQGPPTSAKPFRLPANINLILGNKEQQNQSVANVSIQERRSQMLANLTGTSHPLLQENYQHDTQNIPTRSISLKDPTPEKSRMEALSKLGLNRNRAMSQVNSSTTLVLTSAEMGAKPLEASVPQTTGISTKLAEAKITTPPQSQIHVDEKPPILRTDSLRSNEDRYPSPPTVPQSSYYSPPLENKAYSLPPPPPEVTSLEFNSYGGKSIVVHPSFSKSDSQTSPTSLEPKTLPPAVANPSEFNTYGGKTKVMNPAPAAMSRNDLPDILSSHIDKSQSLPPKSQPPSTELNSYGGKSRTINPSLIVGQPPNSQARSFKAPAPTPAPKPHRHTIHGAAQTAAPQALSSDYRRKPASMFRPQGITVQFSGRGPTTESRKDALRKLGLLKDS